MRATISEEMSMGSDGSGGDKRGVDGRIGELDGELGRVDGKGVIISACPSICCLLSMQCPSKSIQYLSFHTATSRP